MSRRRGHPADSTIPRLRHRLSVRMLASYILVTICSVTATAWVAVQGTSGAIRTEQGQTLASDTRIYDTLLGYSATHPDWSEVGGLVSDLASDTGRRITLTTQERRPLVDSVPDGPPPQGQASSVIDPLAVDVTLVSDAALDRIDSRAVGPFALTDRERATTLRLAQAQAHCFGAQGLSAKVSVGPSGRPVVLPVAGRAELPPNDGCWWAETTAPHPMPHVGPSPAGVAPQSAFPPSERTPPLNVPTETEKAALEELGALVSECAEELGIEHPAPTLDDVFTLTGPSVDDDRSTTACVESARGANSSPRTPRPQCCCSSATPPATRPRV